MLLDLKDKEADRVGSEVVLGTSEPLHLQKLLLREPQHLDLALNQELQVVPRWLYLLLCRRPGFVVLLFRWEAAGELDGHLCVV